MTGSISLLTTKVLAAAPLLAAPQPGDPGGQGEDFGKSSPVGLLVLILFFIAVGFLVRSMTKHLRKVPASFDEPADRSERDSAKDVEDSADSGESAPERRGSAGAAAEEEADDAASAEQRNRPDAGKPGSKSGSEPAANGTAGRPEKG